MDVIRAFTTAAYAFAAGAAEIHLVDGLDDAHVLLAANPEWIGMGEVGGRRPKGFALSNSPVAVADADVDGRVIVQRTSAGTRGAIAARDAEPLLCASLVVAAATASFLGAHRRPTYVITGSFADAPTTSGDEDLAVAEHIEALRLGERSDSAAVIRRVLNSPDAHTTMRLGGEHVHPDDLAYCVDVDRFDFAMVCDPTRGRLVMRPVHP